MSDVKKYFKLPQFDFLQEINDAKSLLTHHVIQYHFGEHHRLYIEELNQLLIGSELEELSLEEIILETHGALLNVASQSWNHCFYWLCIKPQEPFIDIEYFDLICKKIMENFDSLEVFYKEFINAGKKHFGSGWVWLIDNTHTGKLEILTTSNADTPLRMGLKPILVCDIWEHAYYLDYHQKKNEYLEQFMNSINWSFVEKNLQSTKIPNMTQFMKIN